MVDELGEEKRLCRVLADLRGVVGIDWLRRRIFGAGVRETCEQDGRSQARPRVHTKRHQSGFLMNERITSMTGLPDVNDLAAIIYGIRPGRKPKCVIYSNMFSRSVIVLCWARVS